MKKENYLDGSLKIPFLQDHLIRTYLVWHYNNKKHCFNKKEQKDIFDAIVKVTDACLSGGYEYKEEDFNKTFTGDRWEDA